MNDLSKSLTVALIAALLIITVVGASHAQLLRRLQVKTQECAMLHESNRQLQLTIAQQAAKNNNIEH